MKTFEPNKNAKQLGIDTTKKFVVNYSGSLFPRGEILTLIIDDNTENPPFSNGKEEHYVRWNDLYYAEKNWDTLEVGDVVIHEDGDKSKVLAVLGDVFLKSCWEGFEFADGCWYTKTQAQEYGWTIEGATPTEDEEVEKALQLLRDKGRIVNGKLVK